MKHMRKLMLGILMIVMVCALTGCAGVTYKASDVTIKMDKNGKGYMEQSFSINKEALEISECKINTLEELSAFLHDKVDYELGIDATYDAMTGKDLEATFRLEFDSYADFNNKINTILDKVNSTTVTYKLYDFPRGAMGIDNSAVVAAHMNKLLDKYNIKYDMNSYEYKYMIARITSWSDVLSEDEVIDVKSDIGIYELEYVDGLGMQTYEKATSYVKEGDNTAVSKRASQILKIYIDDIVLTNLHSILDEEALNKRIKDELIESYSERVCASLDDKYMKEKYVANNITDISKLKVEQIEEIFNYSSVPSDVNWYWDMVGDTFGGIKLLSIIEPEYGNYIPEKVMMNGKELKFSDDLYSIGTYKPAICDNDVDETKEDTDDTPATYDNFPLVVGIVVMIIATMACIVLDRARKRA